MTAVGTTPARERNRGLWWTALGVLACLFGAYSVSVGQFLVEMREPEQLGHSVAGEWADLSEYGFRLRLDAIETHDAMPNDWSEDSLEQPPAGMQFVEARFTLEVLVAEDEDLGCDFRLRNANGEELGDTRLGMAGAEGAECSHEEQRAGIGVGDQFVTHEVYVVPRNMPGPFTIEVSPYFTDDRVYWTFGE